MKINPLQNFPTQGPERKRPADAAPSVGNTSYREIFEGPKTKDLLNKIAEIDGFREELVTRVKEELNTGEYLTNAKISELASRLMSTL
ncbi:MAG: flagellar biosynthesis anti-sigma factor FlgM [Planctomycetes bacterium]|nr:flagellar biosynthesis anti-sigma factor FlgM [Planctomycetota bacterium]